MRRSSPMFATVHQPRRGRARTVLRYGLFALGGLLLAALIAGVVLWRYADSKLTQVDLEALEENETDPDAPQDVIEGTLNVLVVGSDSREGLSEDQLQVLGTEDNGSNLTDTIMLVQVSPVREKAVLVSFPRDLRVDPPGEVGAGKINAVHSRGGPDLLVRTVQDLTGVPIDHYVEVKLAGFLQIAEAVGGVEVCTDERLLDEDAEGNNYTGLDLAPGCHVLDEITAARFVRARHAESEQFGSADFGRIARQQYFISQAMEKVTTAGTLLNPLRVKALIDAVGGSVTTNAELGIRDMYKLANTLRSFDADDLETRVVPSYWDNRDQVVHMYPEQAEELFQSLRDGSDLGEVGIEGPEDLAPEDVAVLVVNGVGTEGLAGDVSDFLAERGFTVAGAVNPQDLDPSRTWDPELEDLTISYSPHAEPAANLLADHLGDLPVVLEPIEEDAAHDADVILTVGSAWSRE